MAYTHSSSRDNKTVQDSDTITAPPAGNTGPKVPETVKKIQEFASPDNFFAGTLVKSLVILTTLIIAPLALEYFTGNQNITSSPLYWLAMLGVAIVYGGRWLDKKKSMEPFVVVGKIIFYVCLAFFILNTAWDVFVTSRPDFKDKKMNFKNFLEFVKTDDNSSQVNAAKETQSDLSTNRAVIYQPGTYYFSIKAGEILDHWIHLPHNLKVSYDVHSSDDMFKLQFKDGQIVEAWTPGSWPNKHPAIFKIIAVKNQSDIKMKITKK